MSCFCPSLLLTSPSVLPRAGAQYPVIWWFRRRAIGGYIAWDCTRCPECQIFINVTWNCPSDPILVVTWRMAECHIFWVPEATEGTPSRESDSPFTKTQEIRDSLNPNKMEFMESLTLWGQNALTVVSHLLFCSALFFREKDLAATVT